MVSHFHEKRFPRICRDVITIVPIQNCEGFSFSLIVFNLFISSASRIFLSYMYGEMRTVFGCSQSNWPWNYFVCSVAQADSHFPLILSCWCSILWKTVMLTLHQNTTQTFFKNVYYHFWRQEDLFINAAITMSKS